MITRELIVQEIAKRIAIFALSDENEQPTSEEIEGAIEIANEVCDFFGGSTNGTSNALFMVYLMVEPILLAQGITQKNLAEFFDVSGPYIAQALQLLKSGVVSKLVPMNPAINVTALDSVLRRNQSSVCITEDFRNMTDSEFAGFVANLQLERMRMGLKPDNEGATS